VKFPKVRLERRAPPPIWFQIMIPFLAVLISLLFSSIAFLIAGINPITAIFNIFKGALGSRFAILETIVTATPIILTGIAVAIAFSGGFWNIGAEGQLYAGALCATWVGLRNFPVSRPIYIIIIIVFGFVGGGLWALIPGILKVKYKVDDVVTTLLLNSVMIYIVSGVVYGPWRDPVTNWPQSVNLPTNAIFPALFPRSRVHFGFIIALLSVIFAFILFKRMKLGFEIKAVGSNARAANFLGLNVGKTIIIVAIISGGIAGLAGVGEIFGLHYHLVDNFSSGYGYTGIVVAMLGRLKPIGVFLSAFFFAIIIIGAQVMSRTTGINIYIAQVIQGITLLVMLAMLLLTEFRLRRN